jgi:hypothetical protein
MPFDLVPLAGGGVSPRIAGLLAGQLAAAADAADQARRRAQDALQSADDVVTRGATAPQQ